MKRDEINLATIYYAILELAKEVLESPIYWNSMSPSPKKRLLSRNPKVIISTEHLRARELKSESIGYRNDKKEGWFHNGVNTLEGKF